MRLCREEITGQRACAARRPSGLEPNLGFRLNFFSNVRDESFQRVEIFGNHLVVFHGDREVILQITDEFQNSSRIDNIPQQSSIIKQILGAAIEELDYKKMADVTFDVCGIHGLKVRTSRC